MWSNPNVNKDVIRVKVKKIDGSAEPEYCKFSVDPQLTSFEILRTTLAKAFNIDGDFLVSYLGKDENGDDAFLSLISEWDLDAAFQLACATDACLRLKVDLRPFENGLDDWDVVGPKDITVDRPPTRSGSFIGSLTDSISKWSNKLSEQVIGGLKQSSDAGPQLEKRPMCEAEYRNYLDMDDQRLIHEKEFYMSVYKGGVERNLRKYVWRHLLNVYPEGLTLKERTEYMKRKSKEYFRLRKQWMDAKSGPEIQYIMSTVKKDVVRTDRAHRFYSGSDDNKNLRILHNILVTYAVTHPNTCYCQGMSDLASPILFVENSEPHAYIAFCGLMQRMHRSFSLDGITMTKKFQHLALVIQRYDWELFDHLKSQNAEDLFFSYRWLLLELKREFPLEDACLVWEIMWATIRPQYPEKELALFDDNYSIDDYKNLNSPTSRCTDTVYSRLKFEMRRHHSYPGLPARAHTVAETRCPPRKTGSERSAKDMPNGGELYKQFSGEDDVFLDERKTFTQSLGNKPCYHGNHHRSSHLKDDAPVGSLRSTATLCPDGSINSTLSISSKDGVDDNARLTRRGDDKSSLAPKDSSTWYYDEPEDQMVPSENTSTDQEVPQGSPNSESNCIPVTADQKAPSEPHNSFKPIEVASGLENVIFGVEESRMELSAGVADVESLTSSCDKELVDIALDVNGHMDDVGRLAHGDSPRSQGVDSGYTETHSFTTDNDNRSQSCIGSKTTLDHADDALHWSLNVEHSSQEFPTLPNPDDLGCGNPFLLFLCLSLFVQERETILSRNLDYNEIAIHFDRMVRQHKVNSVLRRTQELYGKFVASFHRKQEVESSGDSFSKLDVSL